MDYRSSEEKLRHKFWEIVGNKNPAKMKLSAFHQLFSSDEYSKNLISNGLLTEREIKFLLSRNERVVPHYCEICGKLLHLGKIASNGFRKTCKNCGTKLTKKTMLSKYGVSSGFRLPKSIKKSLKSSKLKETQNKREKTCLEKFGTKSPFQNESIKDKIKKTCLEKYGNESFSKTDEFKKSYEKTCLEKFGVKNVFESGPVRDDIISLTKSKFRGVLPQQTDEVKEKMKQTNLRKFGLITPLQDKTIRENISRETLDKTFSNVLKFGEKVKIIPLFDRNDWKGFGCSKSGKVYRWKCLKCGEEFESTINGSNEKCFPRCPKCDPKFVSRGESELRSFIVETIPDETIIFNDRTILDGFELDLIIPERKLAFEFNGDYFHSIEFGKDPEYHLRKTIACERLGIRLFHVWENDWNCRGEEIRNKLKNVLDETEPVLDGEKIVLDRSFPYGIIPETYHVSEITKPEVRLVGSRFRFYDCGKIIFVENEFFHFFFE